MSPAVNAQSDEPRMAVLLEHFAQIEDPRDVRRILHPLAEILLLVANSVTPGASVRMAVAN